jgi:hypothetical protein
MTFLYGPALHILRLDEVRSPSFYLFNIKTAIAI